MKKGVEILKPLEELYFIDVHELYESIEYIKSRYMMLPIDYKTIYKWFFFQQLCLLKEFKINPIKTIMWEYINGKCSKKTMENSYKMWCEYQGKN